MPKPSETQVGGDHYRTLPIQPSYFCHVNRLRTCESNVVKYVSRHGHKGGKEGGLKDIRKARHYIELLLEWEYEDGAGVRSRRRGAIPRIPWQKFCGENRLPEQESLVVKFVSLHLSASHESQGRSFLHDALKALDTIIATVYSEEEKADYEEAMQGAPYFDPRD